VARFVMEKNSTAAIAKINELLEDGYDLEVFNKSLVNYLRQLMLLKIDPALGKYFSFEMPKEQADKMLGLAKISELAQILSALNLFLEAQSKIASFILPQLPLEIAIIKATHTFPAENPVESIQYKVSSIKPATETKKNPLPSSEEIIQIVEKRMPESNGKSVDLYTIKQNWNKLLVAIRPFNHSISALLSNCQPQKTEGQTLTLATPYQFYQERLNEGKNKLTLEEVFSKILGVNLRVAVVLDQALAIRNTQSEMEEVKKPEREQNPLLDSALEIMGGKIVE